ncbi:MAG TPA: cytochrome P450 [Acidimicrobiales bacterium]|nr:cytochrome P450 [Acidimicrobiales bacterium]
MIALSEPEDRRAAAEDRFDPLVLDTEVDAHELYREMRAACPVAHSDRFGGFWAIFGYQDVQRVLTDSRTFITSVQNIVPRIAFTGRRPPLHLDPPEHTVYRRVLNPLISDERVASVEPTIRRYAKECLVPLLSRGGGDYGEEFAANYPILAFARFLNVDDQMMYRIRDEFEVFNKAVKDDDADLMVRASLALYEITKELIADRQAHPKDPTIDPASALLAAQVDGEPLPIDMVIGTVRQVLLVGIVAPRFVLGSMVARLAGDPDLQDQLRRHPDLIGAAIEELLRLDSPYRGFARTANRDVTIGDRLICKDEPIAMVFEAPDEFRFDRAERHIAFGLGPHQCPGAAWARMELRVALEELLSRTTSFSLDGPLDMTRWPEFGATSVPLRIVAREGE